MRNAGMQVAVPTCRTDSILVTFQTLSVEASSRVLENREKRAKERMRCNDSRRAARAAKEARDKVGINTNVKL